jgi:WASH complex subunit strumpellin
VHACLPALSACRWDEYRNESSSMVAELSDYFSGERQLVRVKKNENLQAWFKNISDEIKSLDYAQAVLAGRKIGQLMQALTDVQEYNEVDSNLQVKQFLHDVSELLTKMIRVVNVTNKVMADMDIISDFSYAKVLLQSYTPIFHQVSTSLHVSFIIYHLSFIIYHLSFIIYHLSFIINHLYYHLLCI